MIALMIFYTLKKFKQTPAPILLGILIYEIMNLRWIVILFQKRHPQ